MGCSVRALVIGYGSIGSRHARLLTELGCETAILSQRQIDFRVVYADLASALSGHRPDYVVVANPTNQHHATLSELAATGFGGRVLIEKPLFEHARPIPDNSFGSFSVAYNLRFHPVIQRLRELVANESVLSVQAYVGQYLPGWRPGTDYRQSYSASAEQGGGALRDLSHEFDYLGWLFGHWRAVTALGGHVSSLEIDSDDLFVLLMQTDRCPVLSVQVSYLDRGARRRIIVNTERHTIEADLVGGTITVDRSVETFSTERDYTYREMHRALLAGNFDTLCPIQDGLATLQLIEAAEQANRQKEWITR
jgi:predicted dehydrogenase